MTKNNKMTCAPSEDSDQPDAQADLSLRLPQRSFCWFCYVVAQLFSDIPVKSSRVVVLYRSVAMFCGVLFGFLRFTKICWIEYQA